MVEGKLKQLLAGTWEVVEVVIVALAAVFIIRTFLFQPFLVSGASMEPTFSDGNYLLVDEITYRFREPNRGEVVVFRYPLDRSLFFIKRIIGEPGERIISKDGKIRVMKGGSEIILDERYLPKSAQIHEDFDVTLGPGQYFVMGDNRYHSFDSRNWGAINRDDIIGIARVRVLPLADLSVFRPPVYK